eukprot:5730008-Amphidinium_carterae.1
MSRFVAIQTERCQKSCIKGFVFLQRWESVDRRLYGAHSPHQFVPTKATKIEFGRSRYSSIIEASMVQRGAAIFCGRTISEGDGNRWDFVLFFLVGVRRMQMYM